MSIINIIEYLYQTTNIYYSVIISEDRYLSFKLVEKLSDLDYSVKYVSNKEDIDLGTRMLVSNLKNYPDIISELNNMISVIMFLDRRCSYVKVFTEHFPYYNKIYI